jgi:hypothetical protein
MLNLADSKQEQYKRKWLQSCINQTDSTTAGGFHVMPHINPEVLIFHKIGT